MSQAGINTIVLNGLFYVAISGLKYNSLWY